jgi:hypothetical protein
MFKDDASVETLEREAMRVEHFATTELLHAKPDDPVGEVLAWMTGNDVDVVPIGVKLCHGVLLRGELKIGDRTVPLHGSARPLGESVVLSPLRSLREAMQHLVLTGWFFVW